MMRQSEVGIEIPAGRVVSGRIQPPPSKSLTQRVLNLSLLQDQRVTIDRPLVAADTDFFLGALETIGVEVLRRGEQIELTPKTLASGGQLWCGDNGTMLRFLTASLATIPGEWLLDGSARLRQRTVAPLVVAMKSLGAEIEFADQPGFAPVKISGRRLSGGEVELDASKSSQFASALLMAATQARESVAVKLRSPVSTPYLDLTLSVLEDFGASVEEDSASKAYRVLAKPLHGGRFTVEADFSAAAYPAAAALLTRGEVVLTGLGRRSKQGDRRFLDVLQEMGAHVSWGDSDVAIGAAEDLVGIEVDLADMPDQVPTLAAIAPFAKGSTVIRNVGHLRIKESDRLAAMALELRRLGAVVEERPAGLRIEGCWHEGSIPANTVRVESHGDHRIAMSLAVCGLRRPGVVVDSPSVVAKSYPRFWEDFESLLLP
jgi:3-phosphoshikimate 1-carboxyvinyltransferase